MILIWEWLLHCLLLTFLLSDTRCNALNDYSDDRLGWTEQDKYAKDGWLVQRTIIVISTNVDDWIYSYHLETSSLWAAMQIMETGRSTSDDLNIIPR